MAAKQFKTYSTAPDAFAVFYPYKQEDTRHQSGLLKDPFDSTELVVRDEIMQISTSKPKNGTGTFSMVLSPSQRFKSKLHPGCWCLIYISNKQLTGNETSTEDSGLRMMGIVRSIRMIEETDPNTGIRYTRYQISGDDFQSVFDNTLFLSEEQRSSFTGTRNPDADALTFFNLTALKSTNPKDIMKWLLDALLGKASSFEQAFNSGAKVGGVYGLPKKLVKRLYGKSAPNDQKVVSTINFSIQQNLLGDTVFSSDFGSKVNTWSILKTYSNPILNEIYTDICPVATGDTISLLPTFVFRTIPFSSQNRIIHGSTASVAGHAKDRRESPEEISPAVGTQHFLSKDIPDEEIMSLNHGKSDSERFNFFLVAPVANSDQVKAFTYYSETAKKIEGADPLADINSLVRYGYRGYSISGGVMVLAEDTIKQVNQIVRDMWYPAHLFENGQVTIIGSSKPIPVGTNIRFTNRGWIAHVEAVSNSFSVSADGKKHFGQTISFVRLQKTSGKPIDSVEKTDEPLAWEPGRSNSNGDKP